MFQETILSFILTIMSAAVTCVLIPALALWLKSRIDCNRAEMMIDDLLGTVSTTVSFLEQTYVAKLKADGEWNPAAQREVHRIARDMILESINRNTRKSIAKGGRKLNKMISMYIEADIYNRKCAECTCTEVPNEKDKNCIN